MSVDKYSASYMVTHDIDWFCKIGDIPVHCASNGGLLPTIVNVRSQNRKNQEVVASMLEVLDPHEEVVVNYDYVRRRLGNNDSIDANNQYVSSFVSMARKGFMSFDRVIDDRCDDVYEWVAKPARRVEMAITTLPSYEEGKCPAFARDQKRIHVSCLDSVEF